MTKRILVMQLVVWLACSSQAPAPPPPPSQQPQQPSPQPQGWVATWQPSSEAGDPRAAALVRRADEAFASMLKSDYRRPHVQEPLDRPGLSDLYLEACRAGERRSCWLADAIFRNHHTVEMVRRNCLAGDVMSCRAIPEYDDDKRLRGWVGRTLACGHHSTCEEVVKQECKRIGCREKLQEECAAGFAASCWNPFLNGDDRQALAERQRVAHEGCQAGILEDCALARHGPNSFMSNFADEQHCNLAAQCKFLSSAFEHAKEPLKARDALERGCQYTVPGSDDAIQCVLLAGKYKDGLYPEPVPDRGRALAEWDCTRSPGPAYCLQGVREAWSAVTRPD